MASTQIRQQTPFMVKIFLVMHVIMHFSMNCKLYFQLNQLLVTLSQHRSGESFSTSQNTENLSSSFSSTCAQLPAKLLMWREIPGEGARAVSSCGDHTGCPCELIRNCPFLSLWGRAAYSPIYRSCSVLTRTTFSMKLKTSISWSFREYKPLGIKCLAQ